MDRLEGPAWALCIDRGDVQGLRGIVTAPEFDFQQPTHVLRHGQNILDLNVGNVCGLTPIGYALWSRTFWAFEMLLEAGANPDAEHIIFMDYVKIILYLCRPIEFCCTARNTCEFLQCLLEHGASTIFIKRSSGKLFIKDLSQYSQERNTIVLAAHARELRAYTAVWCACHAGGCWPDMAMLLQAVIMSDELRETLPIYKRRRN